MSDTTPTATDQEVREMINLTIDAINRGILNKNNPLVISPPLAAKLAELSESGLDIKVVAANPDSALVLVMNADPETIFMTVALDNLDRTLN